VAGRLGRFFRVVSMPETASATVPPAWMGRWLVGAGIYNLAWGALTVLYPGWLFDLTGMEPPRYPFIWACVGMIVGVYGIGYLAAAAAPLVHWPIVLVGLLGKVFGPLGYLAGAVRGEVPWEFGVTLPTNDILWWIPFSLILVEVWRRRRRVDASEAYRPAEAA
jgi:small multidrug resistance pump